MTTALLHAAAVALLASVLSHYPWIAARIGRNGYGLVVAGGLIPLLDYGVFFLHAPDRIAFLIQDHLFFGPFFALLLISSLAGLTAFAVNLRWAGRVLGWLTVGYGLHVGLAFLTPAGFPALAPFQATRMALPIFWPGHPLLIGVLIAALVALKFVPRRRPFLLVLTLGLLTIYGVSGAGQYGFVWARVPSPAAEGVRLVIEPANPWPTRWFVIEEGAGFYRVRREGLVGLEGEDGGTVAAWDNEPLFLQTLGDPVVRRFYRQAFRHPVVRVTASGSQITLVMQELTDLSTRTAGRSFHFESDPESGNRLYRVERF